MPKTEFSKKIKGKNINIIVATHRDDINDCESWGIQYLCPWGCSEKFLLLGRAKPQHVARDLWARLEKHFERNH